MNIDVFPDGRLVIEGKAYKCAIGKGGVKSAKFEDDGATPEGCYPLRRVFYRADRLKKPLTSLDCQIIRPNDGWCDDPGCGSYNKLVKLPHSGGREKLWRDDHVYDIAVPLGYNDSPIAAGKGSAIFLHLAREDYSPTKGCIALNKNDLLEILQKVHKSTQICIHSKSG